MIIPSVDSFKLKEKTLRTVFRDRWHSMRWGLSRINNNCSTCL